MLNPSTTKTIAVGSRPRLRLEHSGLVFGRRIFSRNRQMGDCERQWPSHYPAIAASHWHSFERTPRVARYASLGDCNYKPVAVTTVAGFDFERGRTHPADWPTKCEANDRGSIVSDPAYIDNNFCNSLCRCNENPARCQWDDNPSDARRGDAEKRNQTTAQGQCSTQSAQGGAFMRVGNE
jgi:hypothetical protein